MPNSLVQGGEEQFGHLLPDAHRPIALNVGVSAHGAHTGARLADHAAHQQQVGGLTDGRHGVPVLRSPSPSTTRSARRWPSSRPTPAARGSMPVAATTVSRSTCAGARLVVVEARAVRLDEGAVDDGAGCLVVGLQ